MFYKSEIIQQESKMERVNHIGEKHFMYIYKYQCTEYDQKQIWYHNNKCTQCQFNSICREQTKEQDQFNICYNTVGCLCFGYFLANSYTIENGIKPNPTKWAVQNLQSNNNMAKLIAALIIYNQIEL